jgi:membrane-associated phospholipid phosphatase
MTLTRFPKNVRSSERRQTSRTALAALLLLAPLASASPAAAQAVTRDAAPAHASVSAVVRWNATALALVRKNQADPLWAVRTYALLSIAQHDAALTVARSAAGRADSAARVAAAVAASSAAVLAGLYPHEIPRLAADLHHHREELAPRSASANLESAAALGDSIARRVLEEREDDGAASLGMRVPPSGAGAWHSSEHWPPLRPGWGETRPFLISDPEAYLPPPPPAVGSPAFDEGLAAVRRYARLASARHDSLARAWADGPGTATPPGHWNQIAARLITRDGLGEVEAARVLALMNMAMMDASIVCWRAKFRHWLPRPSQADPTIVPSFALPNFPSYPSGHAAFSGAASAFLARRFPADAEEVTRLAEAAALSRVVSGIHYPFDSDAGLRQGRRVAELAIAASPAGAPLLASGGGAPHSGGPGRSVRH